MPVDSCRRPFPLPGGGAADLWALPVLAERHPQVMRLPFALRVILEAVLRRHDGRRVRDEDLAALLAWRPDAPAGTAAFTVARVLLQDFTGVPLLVDLAAMRAALAREGRDPAAVRPRVPVDLVIDHSVQVDVAGVPDALARNMEHEFRRNRERYRFLKWGAQAFPGLRIVPPGIGIVHQVNLERLAPGVVVADGVACFDSLVGTDSHTTMINGLGIVGWGVGGIEAEAAMLGLPIDLALPEVVGVRLRGALPAGATATDLVLRLTELLRAARVVDCFVEFHGAGAASLGVPDRATIANMAPEYGATLGLFPPDERCCEYLAGTGRTAAQVDAFRAYHRAQQCWDLATDPRITYGRVVELDLATVEPSVAGPKRPQDRVPLGDVGRRFRDLLARDDAAGYGRARPARTQATAALGVEPASPGGGAQATAAMPGPSATRDTSAITEGEMADNRPTPDRTGEPAGPGDIARIELRDGSVVIAAITSCTNTSNPDVMIAAGLLARNAVRAGLRPPPWVKASLAPGSRAVTAYLERCGLLAPLAQLGFHLVGYGCTTCIGNSGPLDPAIEGMIRRHDLVVASVLSGNRNFEARVHQAVRANWLMSPPLVVAFALAGRVDLDPADEPLGRVDGHDVFLRDLWPSAVEIAAARAASMRAADFADPGPGPEPWRAIAAPDGPLYAWDPASTYIREPPYFTRAMPPAPAGDIRGARVLAVLGDSVTTDHISPAGAIRADSPAGAWLRAEGVPADDFNSYGARRGNHEVMLRGTFANPRLRNRLLPAAEGGLTLHGDERLPIPEAAARWRAAGVPLLVIAGREYGTGSSRDWAAKGTRLLGVQAVVARSFERIHRANLVGMGVLPCECTSAALDALGLTGDEAFDLLGLAGGWRVRMPATLVVRRADGGREELPLTVRLDTPLECEQFALGGLLAYVFREIG